MADRTGTSGGVRDADRRGDRSQLHRVAAIRDDRVARRTQFLHRQQSGR